MAAVCAEFRNMLRSSPRTERAISAGNEPTFSYQWKNMKFEIPWLTMYPVASLKRGSSVIGNFVTVLLPLPGILHKIRSDSFTQADEAPFQLLKEPGKSPQSQSYLGVLRGGVPEHPLVYCEYDPSRSAEVPKRLLRGFQGFLQTAGYEGYSALGAEPGIVHVGCWAHTRRKFDDALRGQGKSKKKGSKRTGKESHDPSRCGRRCHARGPP